jgi:organic hydroperoxide reductase OsmC/OhrA
VAEIAAGSVFRADVGANLKEARRTIWSQCGMSLTPAVTSPATIARAASDLAVRVSAPKAASELRAVVDDATEHCPVCHAIRGNVAIQVTVQSDA